MALKDVTDRPGAAAFHTLGRVYLAEQKFGPALEWLSKAADGDPQDARIQSDLGAAFLETGRQDPEQEKQAEEMVKSLDHLDKALQLDSSLLEARFNRALLYEYMHVPERAKAEWQSYLERDSKSGWADEARRRLTSLEERQGSSYPNGDRDFDAFVAAARDGDETSAWKILVRNRSRSDNAITQRLIERVH